jgi:hypothetical protein
MKRVLLALLTVALPALALGQTTWTVAPDTGVKIDSPAIDSTGALKFTVTSPTDVGICGSANGVATTSAPTSNLCAMGTASAVTGTGPWNWTCSATLGSPAQCSAPTAGPTPIARWSLKKADISGATVADASGNGNSATVVNGPLAFGSVGATFNGSSQYVDSTLAATSPFTVSAWFNASNLGTIPYANPRIVANSHTDTDSKGFQLMFNSGGGSGFFDVGNGTAEGRASWSKQLSAGTLYHYVGVYDGATVKAYINGTQVASVPFSGNIAAAGHINVARNPAYGGDFLTGAIADVRIFKAALSATDVLTLYQAGVQ